jgi:ADP-ribosylglycohydrolase
MIGHAVGDALGVPVEFCAREELLKNPVMDMMGFGSYPMPAGAWSDDTSMSVAALDSLANGEILYDEIMGNFVKWANLDDYTPTGEMFDIGVTCKKAIRKFVEEEGISPLACGLPYENANGNGSLMRIHPFVLMVYFRDDLRPLAVSALFERLLDGGRIAGNRRHAVRSRELLRSREAVDNYVVIALDCI